MYHVYARGNRRQEIARDDADRLLLLAVAENVVAQFGWYCHAYCLMTNHYHFLFETPAPDLSQGMQRLNGIYAQLFNRRHGLDGHLFQGRFGGRLIESNWHLIELSRYVVLNPVRAGICDEAGDWPWSSYRATAGLAPRPALLTLDLILAQFGRDEETARQNYAAYVAEAAKALEPPMSPLPPLVAVAV